MPRGTPDGKIETLTYAGQASDLGSISNNLYGFSSISGQGRVNFLDTFNNGLVGWYANNSGGGTNPTLQMSASNPPETIFSPPASVKFNPGITTGARSLLTRRQFLGTSPQLGIEAAILLNTNSPDYRISLDYNPVGTTAAGYYSLMRYNHAAGGAWQIYDGAYKTFYTPGILSDPTISLWVQIKLVCDFVNGKYLRAFIGDSVFDLSSYSLYTPAFYSAIYKGYINMEFSAESFGAASLPGYGGYVLQTKDEP